MSARRRLPAVPAIVLVCAAMLTLSACTGVEGTGDKGYVTGDGQVTQVDPADRDAPIELAGEDLEGDPIDLVDLRGGVAVVNVWYATCPPCRAEMPDLVAAAESTAGSAEFVGINIRDSSTDEALAFNRTFGVGYPSFYAPDGQALLAFTGTLGPRTVPATVVLDAEGRVAASVIGPLPSEQTLVDLVEEVAAESRAEPGGASRG